MESDRPEFLDGIKLFPRAAKIADLLSRLSFLPSHPLAATGDHAPKGSEPMLPETIEQHQLDF